ncbi:hypothetical protein P1X15_29875 [Runella sp. MFBS21]|uniref:hypothetical protein n=1 Tax=Runella sp. MFBS21 TaxID=3034018 RepID=UPI0023F919C1|nr:hypothetical protein [Runella sp. MFBS21]MDF7821862.1 hypothetical protein [Runella sp. MFBS21]
MKKAIAFVIAFLLAYGVQAQFVVSDPMHTGVTTLIKLIQDPSFKTMVKNIEQLQKVASAVRQFHRGMETVKAVQNCVAKMQKLSAAVSRDGHIYPSEFAAMTQDIEALAAEGSSIFKDMRTATTQSGGVLKMTDAERVNFLDNAYKRVSKFSATIDRYFAKVRAMSIQRSGNKIDMANTAKLYRLASQVGSVGSGGEIYRNTRDLAYDMGYDDTDTSILDKAYTNAAAKLLREKQAQCAENQANYYDEYAFKEAQMDKDAFYALLNEGYTYKEKKEKISKILTNAITWNFQVAKEALNQVDEIRGAGDGQNQVNVQEEIEKGISNFYDPSGKEISNEEFMVQVRIKARELMRPVREQLRTKWKLDECMTLGY